MDANTSQAARARVLLVDDEPSILRLHAEFLAEGNFDVSTAGSASEAREILAARVIDVVVSDHLMPGCKGADFLAEVREAHPEVVSIMLTGHATVPTALRAINGGQVHRFLQKPCSQETLVEAVASAAKYAHLLGCAKALADDDARRRHALRELERLHPGITHVERTSDGLVRLEGTS